MVGGGEISIAHAWFLAQQMNHVLKSWSRSLHRVHGSLVENVKSCMFAVMGTIRKLAVTLHSQPFSVLHRVIEKLEAAGLMESKAAWTATGRKNAHTEGPIVVTAKRQFAY